MLGQSLSQLAKLDQRGVWIVGENLFCSSGKICEQRIVFGEKAKVR